MDKKEKGLEKWKKIKNKGFLKYLMENILKLLGCFVLGTAITYFAIDKSVITNPTSEIIIAISVVTIVYIISTIIAWFLLVNERK